MSARKDPGTFGTKSAPSEKGHWLSPDDQGDLEFFWCRAAGDLGMRSTSGGDYDRASAGVDLRPEPCPGCRGETPAIRRANRADCTDCYGAGVVTTQYINPSHGGARDPDPAYVARTFDGHMGPLERGRRVHAVLARMSETKAGTWHTNVLYLVYGPPMRHHPMGFAPEVAPLVMKTAVVLRLARDAGRKKSAVVQPDTEKILAAAKARIEALNRDRRAILADPDASSRAHEAGLAELRSARARREEAQRGMPVEAAAREVSDREALEQALKAQGASELKARIVGQAHAFLEAASKAYERAAHGCADPERAESLEGLKASAALNAQMESR